jgi:hypothetical protein
MPNGSGLHTPHGSGGHAPLPPSGAFSVPPSEPSPWSQLTDEVVNEGDTVPVELKETPHAPTRKSKSKSKPKSPAPGRGEAIPVWVIVAFLVGAVLLSLMGIGVVVKMLAK